MSDDWDDDEDFGTFESAGAAPEEAAVSPTPNKIPAWLLDTQSIKSSTTADGLSSNTSKTSSKENLQHDSTSDQPGAGDGDVSVDPYQALRQVEHVTSQSIPPTAVDGAASSEPSSALVAEERSDVVSTANTAANMVPSIIKYNKTSNVVSSSTADDGVVRNSLVTELEMKLNSAVLMREQSEQSFRELRESFSKEIEQVKNSQEERNKIHEKEVEEMSQQHEEEIKQLKQQYSQTGELMTRQLHEMYEAQVKSERLQQEENIQQIIQQCLQLMNKQEELLSAKMKETLQVEMKKFESMKDELRGELNELIQTSTEEMSEKITKSNEDEMANMLKKSIEEELSEQRRVTSQLQRDTHDQLINNFKEELSMNMKRERETNEKKMTEVVEETRKNVLQSCQRHTKRNDATRERHVAAIQMLITSSQEHLSKLTTSLLHESGDS